MSLGADKVLCLKLGYALATKNKGDCIATAFSDEVGLLCRCLVQIYKCSSDHRLRSFRHLGATEIVPLLIQIWTDVSQCDVQGRKHSNSEGDDLQESPTDTLSLSILQLLRVFSKLAPAKTVLIRCGSCTFLGDLLKGVLSWIKSPELSDAFSSPGVFWEALGYIKDLTFRVTPAEKESLLSSEGITMKNLLCHCCTIMNDIHPRIQEWFTAVVWNLVLDPFCCESLLSGIGGDQQGGVVEGLLGVLMLHSTNYKKSEQSTKIKRNAISALGNIAADSHNHAILFRNSRIANSLALLPRLVNLVNDDSDSVVRRRAMRTIRCLASSMDPKTKAAVQNESLSSFLVDVIARNVSQDDENDHDMQIQACHTAITLSEQFSPEDRSKFELALIRRIETTTSTKLISACCQCLVGCSRKTRCPSFPHFCFTEMFWKRLETAVSTSFDSHGSVSCLLLELIKQENLARSLSNAGTEKIPSSLAIPPVINSLTVILSEPDSGREDSRNNALDAVVLMVENEKNKRPLADNEGLLSSLVNMCLMHPGLTNKTAAKRVILDLVPEI